MKNVKNAILKPPCLLFVVFSLSVRPRGTLAKLFFEGLTPKKSNSRFTYGANRILSMELGT